MDSETAIALREAVFELNKIRESLKRIADLLEKKEYSEHEDYLK